MLLAYRLIAAFYHPFFPTMVQGYLLHDVVDQFHSANILGIANV